MTAQTSVDANRPGMLQQPFETLLSNFVSTMILAHNWQFYVNDKPMSAELLSGNRMMLPTILWQAEKTHQMLHGKPLGVQFRADPDAAVGAQAVVGAALGQSRALYPLFCLEVLCQSLENFTLEGPDTTVTSPEVRENTLLGRRLPPKGTACSIDHLIQGFFQDHDLGLVPWTPDSNPKSPNLAAGPNS